MAIPFIESPDATQGTEFYASITGSVTYDTTASVKKSGLASWKCDSGASNVAAYGSLSAASYSRVSFYVCFSHLPSSYCKFWGHTTTTTGLHLCVTSTGALAIYTSTTLRATSTITLSAGAVYRISVVTDNSTTVKAFVNGAEAVSYSTTQTFGGCSIGWITALGAPGANKVMNFQHVYTDDDTSLADPGDIRVTARRYGAGNNALYTTTGGTGACNERPLNETNYKAEEGKLSVLQDYTLEYENSTQADVSLVDTTIIAQTSYLLGMQVYGAIWRAQTFTTPPGQGLELQAIELNCYRVSSFISMNVAIYATSGGFPTGSALATASIFKVDEPQAGAMWITFRMPSTLALDPDTVYAVVFSVPSGSVSNHMVWSYISGAGWSSGQACTSTNSGSSWSANTDYDFAFRLVTRRPGYSIVGRRSWMWYKGSDTKAGLSLVAQGSTISATIVATPSMFSEITATSSYPNVLQGIGQQSTAASTDSYLYECGILVAYKVGNLLPAASEAQAVSDTIPTGGVSIADGGSAPIERSVSDTQATSDTPTAQMDNWVLSVSDTQAITEAPLGQASLADIAANETQGASDSAPSVQMVADDLSVTGVSEGPAVTESPTGQASLADIAASEAQGVTESILGLADTEPVSVSEAQAVSDAAPTVQMVADDLSVTGTPEATALTEAAEGQASLADISASETQAASDTIPEGGVVLTAQADLQVDDVSDATAVTETSLGQAPLADVTVSDATSVTEAPAAFMPDALGASSSEAQAVTEGLHEAAVSSADEINVTATAEASIVTELALGQASLADVQASEAITPSEASAALLSDALAVSVSGAVSGLFSDGFESGDGSAWSQEGYGTFQYLAGAAHSGSYGFRASVSAITGNEAFNYHEMTPAASGVWALAGWMRPVTLGTTTDQVMVMGAWDGVGGADVVRLSWDVALGWIFWMKLRNGNIQTVALSADPIEDSWNHVELNYDWSGTNPVGVCYLNGQEVASYTDITAAGTDWRPRNIEVGALDFGSPVGTHVVEWDDVTYSDAHIGLGGEIISLAEASSIQAPLAPSASEASAITEAVASLADTGPVSVLETQAVTEGLHEAAMSSADEINVTATAEASAITELALGQGALGDIALSETQALTEAAGAIEADLGANLAGPGRGSLANRDFEANDDWAGWTTYNDPIDAFSYTSTNPLQGSYSARFSETLTHGVYRTQLIPVSQEPASKILAFQTRMKVVSASIGGTWGWTTLLYVNRTSNTKSAIAFLGAGLAAGGGFDPNNVYFQIRNTDGTNPGSHPQWAGGLQTSQEYVIEMVLDWNSLPWTAYFYVDGVLVGTKTATLAQAPSFPLYPGYAIDHYSDGANPLEVLFDDARVSDGYIGLGEAVFIAESPQAQATDPGINVTETPAAAGAVSVLLPDALGAQAVETGSLTEQAGAIFEGGAYGQEVVSLAEEASAVLSDAQVSASEAASVADGAPELLVTSIEDLAISGASETVGATDNPSGLASDPQASASSETAASELAGAELALDALAQEEAIVLDDVPRRPPDEWILVDEHLAAQVYTPSLFEIYIDDAAEASGVAEAVQAAGEDLLAPSAETVPVAELAQASQAADLVLAASEATGATELVATEPLALEASAAEAAAVTDTAQASLPDALAASASEAIAVVDAPTVIQEGGVYTQDVVTSNQAVSGQATLGDIAASSSTGITEAVVPELSLSVHITETQALAEAISGQATLGDIAVTDGLSVADTVGPEPIAVAASVSEACSLTELVQASLPAVLAIGASEAITVTELPLPVFQGGAYGQEMVSPQESVQAQASAPQAQVSDALAPVQQVSATLGLSIPIAESAGASEAQGAELDALALALAETAVPTESLALELALEEFLEVASSQGVSASEDPLVALVLGVSCQESQGVSDAPGASLPEALALATSEAPGPIETVSAALQGFLQAQEAPSALDLPALLPVPVEAALAEAVQPSEGAQAVQGADLAVNASEALLAADEAWIHVLAIGNLMALAQELVAAGDDPASEIALLSLAVAQGVALAEVMWTDRDGRRRVRSPIRGTAGSGGLRGSTGSSGIRGTAGSGGLRGMGGSGNIRGTAGSNGLPGEVS